jgi:hypothetical protein
MQERVIFNVGGTPFETTRSTILKHPDTLLFNMLKHEESNTFFVDADPVLFRWILQWYRHDVIVSEVPGIPQEMWKKEQEYYGIINKEEEEQPIYKKLKMDVDEKASKLIKRIHGDEERRHMFMYSVLDYMITNWTHRSEETGFECCINSFTFIKVLDHDYVYPPNYFVLDCTDHVHYVFFDEFARDFKSFCKNRGFDITCTEIRHEKSYSGEKYTGFPAARLGEITSAHKLCQIVVEVITIKIE